MAMVYGRPHALVLILALSPSIARTGGTDVLDWLDRMARAVETMNYRGTLVHVREGRVDTLRVIHRAGEDGVRERIYSLDGQPREILRDREQVRSLLPDEQSVIVQRRFPPRMLSQLPFSRLTDPNQGYHLEMGVTERVAGLQAQVIEIKPRDRYRYGHRLWLEEQTGMLLRTALLDQKGRILQQLSFTEIEIGARIDDAELEPGFESSAVITTFGEVGTESRPNESARPSWLPDKLPAGYLLAVVERGVGPGGEEFEHLVFSDGMASFSVYIESITGEAAGSSRVASIGPVHIYTREMDERRVTVVGEVPAATVEIIGQYLRRASEPALRHFN